MQVRQVYNFPKCAQIRCFSMAQAMTLLLASWLAADYSPRAAIGKVLGELLSVQLLIHILLPVLCMNIGLSVNLNRINMISK